MIFKNFLKLKLSAAINPKSKRCTCMGIWKNLKCDTYMYVAIVFSYLWKLHHQTEKVDSNDMEVITGELTHHAIKH